MFRGKESSNRIKLSRLVQELLNFGVLGSLRIWGWGAGWGAGWMGVGGGWGVPPTHVHMHAHAHTHTHTHACMVNMIIPCKWLPPLDLGKSQGFPMMSCVHVHACVCVRACAHVWDGPCDHPPPPSTHPHPPTPQPHPPTPTPQGGGPPESVKIQ